MNDIQLWFDNLKKSSRYAISEIPFASMDQWYFDDSDTNLRHQGGKFYSIEGIRVVTNYGETQEWEQPIINQPEIGILGILTKVIDGERKYLMQAKMEPQNNEFSLARRMAMRPVHELACCFECAQIWVVQNIEKSL